MKRIQEVIDAVFVVGIALGLAIGITLESWRCRKSLSAKKGGVDDNRANQRGPSDADNGNIFSH